MKTQQTQSPRLPGSIQAATDRHPCYSAEAHTRYARMHLPIAPVCNIQCNYCSRKFDCVHESRPGVTSELLNPQQALAKFLWVKEKIDNLSVVGVAGPGDALANWPSVRESLELIRQADPNVVFCLSTNGLLLPRYADEIARLGIHHVTVTCNAVDPAVGAGLYRYVIDNDEALTGEAAARLLLKRQLAGIARLVAQGVLVKVNIVMVKGINDWHIPVVVKTVKELGAFMSNIMPLIPAPGSAFADMPQTSMQDINAMRNLCELDLKQMRHCQQCRADAIGLLGEDRSAEFRLCQQPASGAVAAQPLKIAVASKYGRLVDQHFGHASHFRIYQGDGREFSLVEIREVGKYCMGVSDCQEEETRRDALLEALRDCAAVLSMRIGYHAKERLRTKGVIGIEYCDSVENGLRYTAEKLSASKEAV
ncbi:MAG: nitrogenase cofactor biosynthesis protein NifB [Sporomusaceae bacterium]|nr:nitrogenase cofactor biosynthesis protein NifB [Sporomusaceae bacterium]